MRVLLTGAAGQVGEAVIDGLADRPEYEFTCLDREPVDGRESVVADVSDYDAIRPAFDGQDAVIHLAAYPLTDGTWPKILENNVIGTYNAVRAAADAGVERFLFASTHHVVGMYEVEHAPDIYDPEFDLTVGHASPARPDSYYGVSKAFGEHLGRYYVEHHDHDAPRRFYAMRISGVRDAERDHPYGDAEHAIRTGEVERGSPEYERLVARRKAMMTSRRDFTQFVDCCLRDESVDFDVFYTVSDNDGRWFDLSHTREVLGYDPADNGAEWDRESVGEWEERP